ncbi:MAG: SCP2 sterol-binding domain-containing protein [Deltaproteobacteria bacterium]|nr:SCP2 sterol-binding domain-containing protein [Deltaproteobacteria bacterium]
MAKYYGVAVEDIFNTMEERFRREGAKGVDALFGYNISGEGGGKWQVTVKDENLRVEKTEGTLEGCSVMLNADAETFVGVTIGKIDAGEAFSSGKISVDGDIGLLTNVLPKIFTKFTPPAKDVIPKDIIDSMEDRFRADKAEGVDMTIGYDLTGENGGKWSAKIKDQTCKIEEGLVPDCTVTLQMDAKIFVGLNLGLIDGTAAFTSGKVKIEGDMGAAATSAALFEKFQVAGAEEAEELISLKCVPSIDERFATGPVMARWFEGLKEKKFYATKCPKCGRTQIPPREICANCRVRCTEFVELGPKATVTYIDTVYYASPDPLTGSIRETPYAGVYVMLDGATEEENFVHELKKEEFDRIKPGMRVRPVWAEKRTGGFRDLLYFEIDD